MQDDAVVVSGGDRTLTYGPRLVTVSDGTTVEHESRGGSLSSVWAADLGGCYVEVVHLGHGPTGGELVLVVPDAKTVAIGDLAGDDVAGATATWAAAIDLALGLVGQGYRILTSTGTLTRDELEDFHQQLLGGIHG